MKYIDGLKGVLAGLGLGSVFYLAGEVAATITGAVGGTVMFAIGFLVALAYQLIEAQE